MPTARTAVDLTISLAWFFFDNLSVNTFKRTVSNFAFHERTCASKKSSKVSNFVSVDQSPVKKDLILTRVSFEEHNVILDMGERHRHKFS